MDGIIRGRNDDVLLGLKIRKCVVSRTEFLRVGKEAILMLIESHRQPDVLYSKCL